MTPWPPVVVVAVVISIFTSQIEQAFTQVLKNTLDGWSSSQTGESAPYYCRRWELSVQDGMLLWNERVVLPASLRDLLLNDLHAEHTGIVRMVGAPVHRVAKTRRRN